LPDPRRASLEEARVSCLGREPKRTPAAGSEKLRAFPCPVEGRLMLLPGCQGSLSVTAELEAAPIFSDTA
jgi:hypothetical protein